MCVCACMSLCVRACDTVCVLYLCHNAEREDEDIVWLQIAVDDVILVQERQCTHNLCQSKRSCVTVTSACVEEATVMVCNSHWHALHSVQWSPSIVDTLNWGPGEVSCIERCHH